ncbi:MAG: 3-oxoacyl-ACP synthase III [Betaproteobacteria bacterium]|nr:3-oxoacyl-ACP synthase III [Betaproteobacteria bacterium]
MTLKYKRVFLTAMGYELGPEVVTSTELEERLAPLYRRLNLQHGQLEAWTGIAERRWWQTDTRLSTGAIAAARKAMVKTAVRATDLGALIYAGVCRENFEPATACAVADAIGVRGGVSVYDLSNACLGVLNGMLDIANRIELGQIRAGLVVSCETAREINEIMLERLLGSETNRDHANMNQFAAALATFTGGSGAIAMLLTDGSFEGAKGHRLRGAVSRVAPEHHDLCRWGLEPGNGVEQTQYMATDSVSVLKHGVQLGRETWQLFLDEMGWTPSQVDRVVCHQVGSGHQDAILRSLQLPQEKDYTTYRYLGNMGTAALPVTAAIAEERGVLSAGQRVGFLGIGSGLTCLMMGLEW